MTITVTIKLFAAYQDACGVPELQRKFPAKTPVPVSVVLDDLIAEYPELKPWRNLTRFGINHQFAEPNTILQDKDEVVLIPPVSGG
ncbi:MULTISPECIES: MoaD/ThiS family protein [unclassified Coleofasciculus]|uniref:MoaD/ThiS family protein n=1 Tax=unclassified Coleofasciculus TaxID=2692782 RepID=UPI00187E6E6C|nr:MULTISPECIES: MoaD/ThiS family protein [unclassified Coleofasciculus]MBE9127663.1 MoaD/ThiS family protein [Coleofasciculus sp. LEGE 07081]MBE9151001.1 MoaD/ThiS family protein [Coleofasciculus sp. LEGE 07092]